MPEFSFGKAALVFMAVGLAIQPSLAIALGFLGACFVFAWEAYLEHGENVSHDINMVMLQNQLDVIQRDHQEVVKATEETKKLLSQANLAMGFKPGRASKQ